VTVRLVRSRTPTTCGLVFLLLFVLLQKVGSSVVINFVCLLRQAIEKFFHFSQRDLSRFTSIFAKRVAPEAAAIGKCDLLAALLGMDRGLETYLSATKSVRPLHSFEKRHHAMANQIGFYSGHCLITPPADRTPNDIDIGAPALAQSPNAPTFLSSKFVQGTPPHTSTRALNATLTLFLRPLQTIAPGIPLKRPTSCGAALLPPSLIMRPRLT